MKKDLENDGFGSEIYFPPKVVNLEIWDARWVYYFITFDIGLAMDEGLTVPANKLCRCSESI